MAEPTHVILGIGSNLGKRRRQIRSALKQLAATAGIKNVFLSPLYESHAVTEAGIDESAPKYLNGVISLNTTLKPKELLAVVRKIEDDHGRVRLVRWGSRTLDIDIIVFGSEIKSGKELTIPHPRAYNRAFVLVPWADIEPDAVLPGYGSVKELAAPLRDELWLAK
jgi:2-amino-4-hydroxy-6-hydroxymethyldihydropteridine diphosphokinase